MDLQETLTRMHNQKLYYSDDPSLVKEQLEYLDLLYDFNHLKPSKVEEKQALLKQLFADIGEECYIETPLYSNWGCKNVHLGSHVYANFNLVLVDDTHIYIGDHVMIGPNVVICTGTHPISPKLRLKQAQYNLPVKIGNNVWIGANSVILPGVTIGDNTIIGAGSIVTKDIPENVIAVGNPCKVSRPFTPADSHFYHHQTLPIDLA